MSPVPNLDDCACGTNLLQYSDVLAHDHTEPAAREASGFGTDARPARGLTPSRRPKVRFDLGFLRLRKYVRKPYADLNNELRDGEIARETRKTRLRRGTFEHWQATGTVEPCPTASTAPRLELCARRERAQRRPRKHGCASQNRRLKPMPCSFAPINLTTCFSSGRGWRGPCSARTVTTVTICCKLWLGYLSRTYAPRSHVQPHRCAH
jgi:hypothetical protein